MTEWPERYKCSGCKKITTLAESVNEPAPAAIPCVCQCGSLMWAQWSPVMDSAEGETQEAIGET